MGRSWRIAAQRTLYVRPTQAVVIRGNVAALGVLIMLLYLAAGCFICFAACRAQRHKVFKILAVVFLSAGSTCALTLVGVGVLALVSYS
jgi:hypothetical protein